MAATGNWARGLGRMIRHFARNRCGGTAITFSLLLPVLVLGVGGAIDYASLSIQKEKLQAASDAAAIAAARELHLANADASRLQPIAESVVKANLGKTSSGVNVRTSSNIEPLSVTVDLSQPYSGYFTQQFASVDLRAHSVARVSGGTPVCVIGLDRSASATVSLDSNAELKAESCAVYSNSKSSTGLNSTSNAVLAAGLICSAGGKKGSGSNFKPEPLTDCPPVDDPLSDRPAPPIGSCMKKNLEVIDKTTTLQPGVYCGGLRIDGNSRVRFAPGIYVIKDGIFNVDSNSVIEGENVGFYMVGRKATFRFASNAKVTLSAPETGPMAGLLFYEARGSADLRRHEILSNFARVMVGTIYLPHGRLIVDADNEVADQSAYTAIIARRVELYSGPKLVLNTDYSATQVPVPDGIAHNRLITIIE
ncbi:MAG: pilus assembly protein TadG-related protein [Hyphomicrobiaceae bacterium]|nr:pilus assembly protein TadG-related protein [Hyphomicrobiaceae bacterium]